MKHFAHIVCIVLVFVAFFLLMVNIEENYVLTDKVIPPAAVTLEEWLENFNFWGTVGLGASLLAAVLWYVCGQWIKLDDWRSANKRPLWAGLAVLAAVGIVIAILRTGRAQEGAALAYGFYTLNGLLSYYLATVMFSPTSFKYTPYGATKIRRWNLTF
ncbi:MAG: hypothetical protein ACJ754_21200 [Pyrinomonadaceae bacterium]